MFAGRSTLRGRLAGAVAIVVIAAVATVGRGASVAPPVSPPTELVLDAPAAVAAGTPIRVGLPPLASGVTSVTLDVVDVWGARRIESRADEATVFVPKEWTTRAGTVRLVATARRSDRAVARGSIGVHITAVDAVTGMQPLVGPRVITADGRDFTEVTTIPRDRYANALPDGTPVVVHVRRPSGAVERFTGTVADLRAGIRVVAGTVAGRSTIRVDVNGQTGPEESVLEVAGPPRRFGLTTDEGLRPADGRNLRRVTTTELRDQFGNLLTDGTSVTLRGTSADGVFSLQSGTIGGRATFDIEAPTAAGVTRLGAFASGVASDELAVVTLPGTGSFPVSAAGLDDRPGRLRLAIGPALTELGGFVPDGTGVDIVTAGGRRTRAVIEAGVAAADIEADSGEAVTLTLLGSTTVVIAP